ncbi:MAG: hypothetical protein SH819_08075 [Cytophagales bacterium]|nr:hypothetical protein [Cytophagales bacterium]
MQKAVCKILFVLFIVCVSSPAHANVSSKALAKADSLFALKQYTQAYDMYHALRAEGAYSPAMLLKMAFIQEGLGHLGESLYYLNLYYLASDDPQALKKMEDLAAKNNLLGYESSETRRFFAWLQEQYIPLAVALAALNLVALAWLVYWRRKSTSRPMYSGFLVLLLAAVLYLHVYFGKEVRRVIVAEPQTYLMSGPSAGASVVDIIGEGHQLRIKGQEDVWLRVEWKNREVYVREFLVRPVRL